MEKLLDEIKTCVSDWDGDFSVTLDPEYKYCDYSYFAVSIQHRSLGDEYEFTARTNGDVFEMDYFEDDWQPITMGNLFAWLWFETAKLRAN